MDNEENANDVLIVPVIDFAFQRVLEDGLHAFPADTNKRVQYYVAFYRS